MIDADLKKENEFLLSVIRGDIETLESVKKELDDAAALIRYTVDKLNEVVDSRGHHD